MENNENAANQQTQIHLQNNSVDEYKKQIVKDDLEKLKNFKIKWYWFIPYFGFIIFGIQNNLNISKMDRGVVRYWYWRKYIVFFIPLFFLIWISLVINVIGILDVLYVRKKVAEKVQNDLDNNIFNVK